MPCDQPAVNVVNSRESAYAVCDEHTDPLCAQLEAEGEELLEELSDPWPRAVCCYDS